MVARCTSIPKGVMAYRRKIGADEILILADIQVKYARMLEERSLSGSAELARHQGADAIVVTGTATGEPPRVEEIEEAKSGASDVPVLIGSGVDASNARALLDESDGAIWYVAAWSHEVEDKPFTRRILDVPVLMYRTGDGTAVAMDDRCPHRRAPLSMGRLEGDEIECAYHGMRFGPDGTCYPRSRTGPRSRRSQKPALSASRTARVSLDLDGRRRRCDTRSHPRTTTAFKPIVPGPAAA